MNREKSHRPDPALEEDSRLLHMLMDHLPHSIFFKDDQHRFIRINKACAIKFGLDDPSQAVGKTDFDFFDKEHAEEAFTDDSRVFRTGEPIINKVEKETFPDGAQKVKWTATTKVPYRDEDGTIIGTFGITRDITESRESEKKYRDIFENIQDVIYRTNKEGIIMDISPSIERYSGYSCKELIGSQVSEFYYYQEDRDRLVEVMKENGKVNDFEIRLKTADGKLVYTSVNSHLLRNELGEVIGVEGIMRDITGRKLAEISLQDTYNFYEQILETVSEGIFVCDHNLKYTYWNREMEKISGLSESEVIGKSPTDIFPHVQHNELLKNYQLALAGENVASEDYFYHVPETNHYGWAQAQYVPMKNNAGQIEGVLVTLVEISERKEVEERLRESDETLRKLSEQVPGTIYQFQMLPDRTFKFPYASQGFRKIYGIEPADV
ncbi:MAG: PAS domain S-box protein, partial [Balneolaceae bacterium]|nr:PAS domain S-box protein [Balneolaceae bacterium]